MLNVLIPIILTLLCIAGIVVPKIVNKSLESRIDKLDDEIWKFEALNQNLTDPEAKRWNSLKRQREILRNKSIDDDTLCEICSVAVVATSIWSIIVLVILVGSVNKWTIQKNQIKNQARYRTITTELENPEVRDALNIRMKDIIDDAIEWNADYDSYIISNKNPWTNWFNPLSVLDGVDRIDIDNHI